MAVIKLETHKHYGGRPSIIDGKHKNKCNYRIGQRNKLYENLLNIN